MDQPSTSKAVISQGSRSSRKIHANMRFSIEKRLWEDERKTMYAIVEQLRDEITLKHQQNANLTLRKDKLIGEKNDWITERKSLQDQTYFCQRYKELLLEEELKVSALIKEKTAVENERSSLQQQVATLSTAKANIKASWDAAIAETAKQKKEKEAFLAFLDEEMSKLNNSQKKDETNVRQRKEMHDALREVFGDFTKILAEKNEENQRNIALLRAEKLKVSAQDREKRELQCSLEVHEAEVASLKQERDNLQSILSSVKDKDSTLANENHNLCGIMQAQADEVSALEREKREIQRSLEKEAAKVAALKRENKDLHSSLEAAESKVATLENEKQYLNGSSSESEAVKISRAKRALQLGTLVATLVQEKEALQKALDKKTSEVATQLRLKRELQTLLQQEALEIQRDMKKHEDEMQQLNDEINREKSRWSETIEKLEKQVEDEKKEKESFQTAFDKVKQEMLTEKRKVDEEIARIRSERLSSTDIDSRTEVGKLRALLAQEKQNMRKVQESSEIFGKLLGAAFAVTSVGLPGITEGFNQGIQCQINEPSPGPSSSQRETSMNGTSANDGPSTSAQNARAPSMPDLPPSTSALPDPESRKRAGTDEPTITGKRMRREPPY